MLLIFTGSSDGTVDRILLNYEDPVFRFNYDIFSDYRLIYTPDYWEIMDPSGRCITSETATKAFWWKAFESHITHHDSMIVEEVKYIFRDLYGWFVTRGLAKGNPPFWHASYGKINILGYAKKYFLVPNTAVLFQLHHSDYLGSNPVVAKGLSSTSTSDKKLFFTSEVELNRLDGAYPWYLQTKIESEWDVTIFVCGDGIFPYRRSRNLLKGLDWRAEQGNDHIEEAWKQFNLKFDDHAKVLELNRDLGVDFGRYDFMLEKQSGELIFLELNATGHWAFLDFQEKYGLAKHVAKWLAA